MNIKDAETERLAAEVAEVTGETKTAAVRTALRERLERLRRPETAQQRGERLRRFLAEEIWPHVPAELRGRRTTRAEREEILGYGPHGA